ncbi:hypothetical protein BT96DRAFT_947203 [Gymnopus androsaceus JB14]|uniref:Uncharacterized protein n=1 Tax=Gymnopus androsaceus JB14 TaxID=1447944 RepID=A0A6A4GVB1_9AGAR|nr:hypothetical protein BT96DRAFT_947203 [Gymnopus androsaceus JB14]
MTIPAAANIRHDQDTDSDSRVDNTNRATSRSRTDDNDERSGEYILRIPGHIARFLYLVGMFSWVGVFGLTLTEPIVTHPRITMPVLLSVIFTIIYAGLFGIKFQGGGFLLFIRQSSTFVKVTGLLGAFTCVVLLSIILPLIGLMIHLSLVFMFIRVIGRTPPIFVFQECIPRQVIRVPTAAVTAVFFTGLGAVIIATALFCYRPNTVGAWYIVPTALAGILSLIMSKKEEKGHIMASAFVRLRRSFVSP